MATLEHQRPGIKERGFVAKINFALFHDCWGLTRAPLIGHFAKTIKHGDCLRYGFRNGTPRDPYAGLPDIKSLRNCVVIFDSPCWFSQSGPGRDHRAERAVEATP